MTRARQFLFENRWIEKRQLQVDNIDSYTFSALEVNNFKFRNFDKMCIGVKTTPYLETLMIPKLMIRIDCLIMNEGKLVNIFRTLK